MADDPDQTTRRRRWPYVFAAIVLAPIGGLVLAKGADNWCDADLMAASEDGSYSNKKLSVSRLGAAFTQAVGTERSPTPDAARPTGMDLAFERQRSSWSGVGEVLSLER